MAPVARLGIGQSQYWRPFENEIEEPAQDARKSGRRWQSEAFAKPRQRRFSPFARIALRQFLRRFTTKPLARTYQVPNASQSPLISPASSWRASANDNCRAAGAIGGVAARPMSSPAAPREC